MTPRHLLVLCDLLRPFQPTKSESIPIIEGGGRDRCWLLLLLLSTIIQIIIIIINYHWRRGSWPQVRGVAPHVWTKFLVEFTFELEQTSWVQSTVDCYYYYYQLWFKLLSLLSTTIRKNVIIINYDLSGGRGHRRGSCRKSPLSSRFCRVKKLL